MAHCVSFSHFLCTILHSHGLVQVLSRKAKNWYFEKALRVSLCLSELDYMLAFFLFLFISDKSLLNLSNIKRY